MFSFIVKDMYGNTVATGVNNANGTIHFSSIEFSAPGIYTFTVEEVRGNTSGITYDGSIFTVVVTVTEIGNGFLEAEVAYPVNGIVFNNRYTEKPCCCIPCCQACCRPCCVPCCIPSKPCQGQTSNLNILARQACGVSHNRSCYNQMRCRCSNEPDCCFHRKCIPGTLPPTIQPF